MERIRLLLVDDHVLFRDSLSRWLSLETDFEVVADCGTANEALGVLQRAPVDVVLLDFDLAHETGTRFIAASRGLGDAVKIVMVTARMTAMESAAALNLGASGILLKHASPTELVQAIRAVANGAIWVDPNVIRQLAAHVRGETVPHERAHLTEREHQVLDGVFEGLANKEIGARLGISESAVKSTLQQLFRKTRVRTRSQLVRVALEGALSTTRKS